MGLSLTRAHVRAIAKLDFADIPHTKRLDLIAHALGAESQTAMMHALKAAEGRVVETPEGQLTAAVEGAAHVQDERTGRLPTLTTLGPNYHTWAEALRNPGLLLIVGQTGTGKSLLAAASTAHLSRTGKEDESTATVHIKTADDIESAIRLTDIVTHVFVIMQVAEGPHMIKDALQRLWAMDGRSFARVREWISGAVAIRNPGKSAGRVIANEVQTFHSEQDVRDALDGKHVFFPDAPAPGRRYGKPGAGSDAEEKARCPQDLRTETGR